ncbi:MAG: CpaF family protein [Clostridia bacterium]|nr:CpaF family protein [Clostridia bacterium]
MIGKLKARIEAGAHGISDEELKSLIASEIRNEASLRDTMTLRQLGELAKDLYSDMRGFGILDPLISDPGITEIMINGPDKIFIERDGRITDTGKSFESEKKLEDIIQRIVGKAGREVNRARPIVDTRLPDGSRVNVVLPPVALGGAVMTVRRFPSEPMTMKKLIELGSLTEEAANALELLVKARYNIFISGGTGSGKTTFLGALSGFIDGDERIITVEDSAELMLCGIKNLVSLETRNANSTGQGEVTIGDLIRTSLRMRPERIIVGEVRGGEALDMLQAMNTGHDGSVSTGHANSPSDMLRRLETMVLQRNAGPGSDAIRAQIASAVDIVVHLSRMRDKSRKTVEISEVLEYDPHRGEIELNPLFVFEEDPDSTKNELKGRLKRSKNRLKGTQKLVLAGFDPEILNGEVQKSCSE